MRRGSFARIIAGVLMLTSFGMTADFTSLLPGFLAGTELGTRLGAKQASAAVVRVQSVIASNNGAATVVAAWPAPTTATNLLVAVIAFRGGSGVTITPPAGQGWTQASRSDNGTTISTIIYYSQNANSVSGNSTWTLSASNKATLSLLEYSGMEYSGVLDVTATAQGSSATGDSGLTGTMAEADMLAVAGISVASSSGLFSGQTNSFVEVHEIDSTAGAAGTRNNTVTEERIYTAGGTARTQATIAVSAAWAGAIATFKARKFPAVTSVDVTATVDSQTAVANGVTAARVGDTIRLNGSQFGASQGGSTVTVNGQSVTPSAWSATQISGIVIPLAATISGNIVVTVGVQSGSFAFTILPRITSISPNEAPVGSSVTINGDHFGTDPGAGNRCLSGDTNSVRFAGTLCDETAMTWSDTQIVVNVPTGASTGDVVVRRNSNRSNVVCLANTCTFTVSAAQQAIIGSTNGSMVTALDSGATSQYANATTCSGPTSCAAFTILITSGPSKTLNSIKLTEIGTVDADADLSNLAIFYDTDGNYSNGVTGQFGTTSALFASQASTVTGSLAMSSGTTYYFYVRFDLAEGGTYPKAGQTVGFQVLLSTDVVFSTSVNRTGTPTSLNGSTTVRPNATGISYPVSPDGARSGQSVTISGFGFGVPVGADRVDCTTATVDKGCIKFIVGGTTNVAQGDITAWSNTSVSFTVNANLASDGGAAAVEMRGANQADATPLTFYIYPTISAIAALDTLAAREYDAGDTDGLIMLSGDHFGASGSATVLGSAATQHGSIAGPCTSSGYSSTVICLQVPTAIADNVYLGDVVLTRGSDSKTHTISNFRVLPRITSNTPVSGNLGDTVKILGNHFCQTGTCPVSPNRSTASDNIKFGTTQALDADFVNQTGGAGTCDGAGAAWTHGEVCVKVPAATPLGSQPTTVTTNSRASNSRAFERLSTEPQAPDVGPGVSRGQFRSDETTAIAIGGYTNQTTVVFRANITATQNIPMALQIERKPVGTPFVCAGGNCVDAVEGTIGGGGACASCSSLNGAKVTISGFTDNSYHWQARVRNTTTNEYSAWVSFGGNLESAADFIVDTVAPVITNLSCGTPGTNDMTITWDTSGEQSTSRLQYNLTGTFGACSGDCTSEDPALVFNHSVLLSNLNSGTTYYFRARSKDPATNEGVSGVQSCSTQSVGNNPAKSVTYHVTSRTAQLGAAATANANFTVTVPENATTVKSAWVRIEGITTGTGTNNIQVQVNSQTQQTFSVPASGNTPFVILYQVGGPNINLNDTPSVNTLTVTPSIAVDALTATVTVMYSYQP